MNAVYDLRNNLRFENNSTDKSIAIYFGVDQELPHLIDQALDEADQKMAKQEQLTMTEQLVGFREAAQSRLSDKPSLGELLLVTYLIGIRVYYAIGREDGYKIGMQQAVTEFTMLKEKGAKDSIINPNIGFGGPAGVS